MCDHIHNFELEFLTWEQVGLAVKNGKDSVIIGFGSTEQHGPHLPLGTDALLAKSICTMVAEGRNDLLMAPVMQIGNSQKHMNLPGTVTIRESILEEYLADYCTSFLQHGFKNIFLMVTHGGNFDVAEKVERRFDGLKNQNVKRCLPGGEFVKLMHTIAAEMGIPLNSAGAHAGELETSIMLYAYHALVHQDRMAKGFCGDYDLNRPLVAQKGITALSPNGIIGDATLADRERGRRYLEKIVLAVNQSIERIKI